MRTLRFRGLTRPRILRAICRPLLTRFLGGFTAELEGLQLRLPGPEAADEAYYEAVLRLFSAPEELPDGLTEALYAVDEMSTPQGQEQLETELARSGAGIIFAENSSRAEMALQVWLADPALLVRAHNQRCLLRLSAFEFFCSGLPVEERSPFAAPDAVALEALAAALDPWFARHHRGRDTTRIEPYEFPPAHGAGPEFWFLIRHGDSFARTSKVEGRRREIIHFRPERDDVVVYSTDRDEIRINTRTTGERDLYIAKFGECLRGRADYFGATGAYTLEPLREDGPASLEAGDVPGIERITLREVEIAWGTHLNEVTTQKADDLFESAAGGNGGWGPIPENGRLARAAFDLHFTGCPRPRPVQIRLPNVLKLGRHCDAQAVQAWLARRGFRPAR